MENIKNYLQKLKKIVFSGLSYIIFGNFLSNGVALLSSILIARFVDKAEYAYLTYADNLYRYIALFIGLGLGLALVVVCTPDVTLEKQHYYLGKALRYGGAVELVAALVICVAVQFLNVPFPNVRKYMWLLVLYPMLTYIFNALQSFIRVKRNNKLYAILGAVQTIIVCFFSILLVFKFYTNGIVFARYIGVITVLIAASYYIRKTDGIIHPCSATKDETLKFFSIGISMMFANMFSGIIPTNEVFIVNNLIKDEIVTANFKVAGIIPSMLTIITTSVMTYYFPIIASIKDKKTALKEIYKIAFINGVMIISVTAAGMLLTPFVIKLVYGEKYVDATGLSYLLWIVNSVNAVFRMVPLNILAAVGESKFTAIVSVLTCVVHIVIDYLFISIMGIRGVAYASIILYVVSAIAMWIYLIKSCQLTNKSTTSGA